MKVAVAGAGILGLTLAHRLAHLGHEVEVFEAGPELGGLACTQDYGLFHWDRYYHCILPQDSALIDLLGELGLGGELRWTRTGTGYYGKKRFHDMNGNADFLRFPLLSVVDKARLAATVIYATRFADPWQLYRVSAEEWLTKLCGRRGYEIFWQPLLKAKFGSFYDRVAAVFIWATLKRLTGARSAATSREKLGYVAGGGYKRILERFAERLGARGAVIRLSSPVVRLGRSDESHCDLAWKDGGGEHSARFDQVYFTGPTRLARKAAGPELHRYIDGVAADHPTSEAYLGVCCMVLASKRPLTPYYVLNIGDPTIELTGVIEMTNLVDRHAETAGLSLIYLPRYMDSADPRFDEPDDALRASLMDRGIKRLFPDLRDDELMYSKIHRARYVQPLPLVRAGGAGVTEVPTLVRPFQVLNTSMLTCATLNNNEVVALVDRFVDKNRAALGTTPSTTAAAS